MAKLTHIDEEGNARMVEVGAKKESARRALARSSVQMNAEAFEALSQGTLKKGDALAVARVAAITGAKRTADLIPLCHPLRLTGIDVGFRLESESRSVAIEVEVRAFDRTGVEMEALTAASVAALTIYDMCKALDQSMIIDTTCLLEKEGGARGTYSSTNREQQTT